MKRSSAYVVCSHCDAVNRIPAGRRSRVPSCAACDGPLLDPEPACLSIDRLWHQLERSDWPIIAFFSAPADPAVDLPVDPSVRCRVLTVPIEAGSAAARRFGIESLPATLLFRHGSPVARRHGTPTAQEIAGWLAG